MTIEKIKLNSDNARKLYESYLGRVERCTASLPKRERHDILMEMNSHIYEAMNRSSQTDETTLMLNILEQLGEPDIVLKPLVAEKKLQQATKTFNPIHVFKALALNISNGISYIIFAILYLFLFAFIFLILAKLWAPSQVGMFIKSKEAFILGIIDNNKGYNEVLGNWFIPVMILAVIICYFIITLLLKLKKNFNKN